MEAVSAGVCAVRQGKLRACFVCRLWALSTSACAKVWHVTVSRLTEVHGAEFNSLSGGQPLLMFPNEPSKVTTFPSPSKGNFLLRSGVKANSVLNQSVPKRVWLLGKGWKRQLSDANPLTLDECGRRLFMENVHLSGQEGHAVEEDTAFSLRLAFPTSVSAEPESTLPTLWLASRTLDWASC